MSLRGGPSSGSCPKRSETRPDGGLGAHRDVLQAPLGSTHSHAFTANMSSLAKIANPETFDMVMKAAARLMIQINVPECYLSPVQDPHLKTTAEECLSQLEKVIFPWPSSLAQEPQYRPTRLLAAVVWLCLKCKLFNGSTA